jgi:hypothetical protein
MLIDELVSFIAVRGLYLRIEPLCVGELWFFKQKRSQVSTMLCIYC